VHVSVAEAKLVAARSSSPCPRGPFAESADDSEAQQTCCGASGSSPNSSYDGSDSQRVLSTEHRVGERATIAALELGEIALLETSANR
jgi:hypothetical protein